MLTETTININHIIDDMKQLSITIKENNSIKELLLLNKEFPYQDQYKFFMAAQDLSKINSYNSLIGETYVYYSQLNLILNRRGTYSMEIGYDRFHHSPKSDYHDWKKKLDEKYYDGEIIYLGGQIAYIQSLFSYNTTNHANMVILFNKQRAQDFIKHSSLASQGNIYVFDTHNNLLLWNTITEEEIDPTIFLEESPFKTDQYTLFKNHDKDLDLTYIAVIPTHIYKKKISYIQQRFILFTLFFIAIVLLGIYFIYTKYEDLQKVIQKLKLSNLDMKDQKYSELDYIEKAVLHMSKEINNNKHLIIENIFRKSLYGIMHNEEEIQRYLGQNFNMSCFIMGSLVLENKCDYDSNGATKLNEFIIQNVFQEVLGDQYDLYLIHYYKGYLLIPNFLGNYHEYVYEDTISRLNTGRTFLESKINLPYILAISNLHTEIGDLSKAYHEVQKALEYYMLFCNEKIITYNNIKKEDKPYLYSPEDHMSLRKLIKSENMEHALQFISDFFEKTFKDRNISLEDTKRILFDLQATLEQIAYEFEMDELHFDSNFFEKKIEQIETEIKEFIILLCNGIHEKNEKKVDEEIQSIITYIQQNYMDNNLTVSLLAETFNMNISYLSRFFKENINENPLQYITKYRIEQAKKLLIYTDYNLNEIAQKVGLLNNVALIRSFKKYEHMTPNEYRIQYKNK